MITHRFAPLAALALLVALAQPAVALSTNEGPRDGACDESGVIACAGIDLGANVDCDITPTGVASCSWTRGWLSTAYSPLALGGSETHVVTTNLIVCVHAVCEGTMTVDKVSCEWLPGASCDDGVGVPMESMSEQLALGECLQITVVMHGHIAAATTLGPFEMGAVTFENEGGDAGATCYVDDGRG